MPKRILVIDDEAGTREAFTEALGSAGHEVEGAVSGEEGLERAGRFKPDLVFLDLKMPGIDGVTTLRRLKKLGADMPIFIVTAFRPEFMKVLREATREGLTFNVLDRSLSDNQIRTLARGVFEGPQVL